MSIKIKGDKNVTQFKLKDGKCYTEIRMHIEICRLKLEDGKYDILQN